MTHFSRNDTYRPEVKGWRKIFHASKNVKKAGIVILSDKTDFKIHAIKKDKEGHCIMIKVSIKDNITLGNIYIHNIKALKYIK